MLKMLLSEAKVPFGEAHPKKEKKNSIMMFYISLKLRV